MPVSDDYLDYLQERLTQVPELHHKRMFGGAGLYRGEYMFAIVADDILYLKADEQNRPLYAAQGSEQFSYLQRGKPARMAYWSVPADVLEDSSQLEVWVEAACACSLRAKRHPK